MNDKEKIEAVLNLFDQAESLAAEFKGGYSNAFLSAEEFYKTLAESIRKLKRGETHEILNLYFWFAPTCDWDGFVEKEGEHLGNSIFELLSELKESLKLYGIVELILDYQAAIRQVMTAFEKKYNRTDLLTAYRHDKILSQIGNINEFGIKQYAFHGIGLQATFSNGKSVDFDFAFLPEQRSDGFDLWRLHEFVAERTDKFKKYANKEYLERDFNDLVQRGSIVNPDMNPSTTFYFFKDSLEKKQTGQVKNQWWKFW